MNNLDLKSFQDREEEVLNRELKNFLESPEYKKHTEFILEMTKNMVSSAFLQGGKVCAKRMLHIMDEVMGKGIPSPFA